MRNLIVLAAIVGFAHAAAAQNAGHWTPTSGKSELTDAPLEAASVEADWAVKGWLAQSKPVLMVRCSERQLEIYIVTGMPASVESGARGSHTTRIRFDEGKPATQSWSDSTDRKALYAPRNTVKYFLKNLEGAERLRFEFIPFNASPVVADFNVRGFTEQRSRIESACGKK